MCGRVVWVWDAATGELVAKYVDPAQLDPETVQIMEKNRYNVPPASHLPFITGEADAEEVRIARWGVPIPKRPNGVFNTRIEGAYESPMWRAMIGRYHGLLPVKGFYEWRRGDKAPHFIQRADGQPMLLAAILGRRPVESEPQLCASIITCEPNETVARLHDRMPVIIEPDDAQDWLHPQTLGQEGVLRLARPAGDVLTMHRVTRDVNNTRNDRPDLIEPKEATLPR